MATDEEVRRWIGTESPESDVLEFKQGLPAKNDRSGSPGVDRWISHGDAIGEYARNELLAEVVAFANAHGGTLIVGVTESETHPKRAVGSAPVPRCADLAARLQLAARDTIDPQVPSLDVRGIPLEGGDDGLVVVEVPESRLAPHRLTATKECYMRRADRTERMSMREIQDLTLFRSAGAARLDQEFQQRRDKARDRYANQGVVTFRVTGIPTSPLYIDSLGEHETLKTRLDVFQARVGATGALNVHVPFSSLGSQPILRGIRTTTQGHNVRVTSDVLQHGLIEFVLEITEQKDGEWYVFPEWVMGAVCNALLLMNRFRNQAGSPIAEYAIDCELRSPGGAIGVAAMGDARVFQSHGHAPPGGVEFPRLSLSAENELPILAGQIYRDLMNSVGFVVTGDGFVTTFPP